MTKEQPGPPKYFYRAFYKPRSIDVFNGFAAGPGYRGVDLGYTRAWHKTGTEISPLAIYNEFICAEIGHLLRMPIPPYAITYLETDSGLVPMFSSLDFNSSFETLPAVIPPLLFEHNPELAAGILAFDILIANNDRHDKNLVADNVEKPKRVHIWDHGQALLGGFDLFGVGRFDSLTERLGITGSNESGGNRHCLLSWIT